MTQKVCFGFWVSRGGDALRAGSASLEVREGATDDCDPAEPQSVKTCRCCL
jgi:hypothetical protein